MITKEIEELREQLNFMLSTDQFPYMEILKVSQELDELIVKYYKES